MAGVIKPEGSIMETWQFWLSWFVQVGIAVGTLGAVLVALFGGPWLRARLIAPKLKLELKSDIGESVPITLEGPDGKQRPTDSRWYHLRVSNESKWSSATQTQVFILRVEKLDETETPEVEWDGEVPIRWRHQDIVPLARTIGDAADADLCSVVKDKWVEFHPLVARDEIKAKRRESFKVIATFQARAQEVSSNKVRVKIFWDGGWADNEDEMKEHLKVEVLPEPEAA